MKTISNVKLWKEQGSSSSHKQPENGGWTKKSDGDLRRYGRVVDSYGTYRGEALPPPGRDNIIVRTPNPLPAPKEVDSK
jgi:hypothetical protein